MKVDLHSHSTVSDGTDSPTELVARMAEAGITTLALTDHDTLAGYRDVRAADAVPGGMAAFCSGVKRDISFWTNWSRTPG